MILYLSSATSYQLFDKYLKNNQINTGYQAQKFNNLLITGLSHFEDIVAVSSLPLHSKCDPSTMQENNITYINVRNYTNKLLHKIMNFINIFKSSYKICSKEKPDLIICDSVTVSSSFSARMISKIFSIPSIAIVTDVPEIMCDNKMGFFMKMGAFFMKRYHGYILLTESMNDIVNPKSKPYMLMEGSCVIQEDKIIFEKRTNKKICMFAGSLGKNVGLEFMIDGFIDAKIDNSELHIYGSGAFETELKEICRKNPSIKYFGSVTNAEVVEKQQEATLLINPRLSNLRYTEYAFPSKLIEYMASGTPVLTTKLAGIPDEYFDFLYQVTDESPQGFSDIFKKLLSLEQDELDKMGLKALEFVKTSKTNTAQAKRIIDFSETIKI